MSKMENKLRQDKVENKVHQQHIQKLQGDFVVIDSEANKGEVTHKIFTKKENTIQLLKRKLNIPSSHLIHDSELAELEKRKRTANSRVE